MAEGHLVQVTFAASVRTGHAGESTGHAGENPENTGSADKTQIVTNVSYFTTD